MPSKNVNKYRQKLKLAACILITNALIYFMATSEENKPYHLPLKKIDSKHSFIQLPLETFVPSIEEGSPQLISIYTPSKRKIIAKAYLHKKLEIKHRAEDQLPLYQVELASKDLNKIIKYKSTHFIAYPINHHHEVNYEIAF